MSTPEPAAPTARGPIAWMAQNPVAANLLMAVLLVGGLLMSGRIKQELFPEFTLDLVTVEVPFPGASPAEVEQGIVRVVEEAVRGLDGVKKVTARAGEGIAGITVELMEGTDGGQALVDVKAAVDRVAFRFPAEAEEPGVRLVQNRTKSVSLVVHGSVGEEGLRALAEQARDDLLKDPLITLVEISGTRPREVAVEIPQATLRSLGLTLGEVAQALRRASVELPGGAVRTPTEEILLRTTQRRDFASEFGEIPIIVGATGARVTVGSLGEVKDTFAEIDTEMTFDGRPAVMVDVYRTGRASPVDVSKAVYAYIERSKANLPPGVELAVWNDRAELFEGRLNLLKDNAVFGLLLVLVALGLMLEARLAFWVMMGIPTSILASFLLLPAMGVSINMISMFAFIVTLGIVVDDAIVVGENVFEKRQRGVPPMQAAIEGCREVAIPVVFAVLTTVATFFPLLFIPGASGKFFSVIPAVVIVVLLFSLLESLFILPAHLAHMKPMSPRNPIQRLRNFVDRGLGWYIRRVVGPTARIASTYRGITAALAFTLFLGAIGMVAGGRLGFTPFPRVEGDIVSVSARLPVGASMQDATALRDQLQASADALIAELPGGRSIVRSVFASVGRGLGLGGGPGGGGGEGSGTHVVELALTLVDSDQRTVGSAEVAKRWREKNKDLIGLDRIVFTSALQAGGGAAVDVALTHRDVSVLEEASARLAQTLAEYQGVTDVDDGFAGGKRQLDITLRPEARALGLTEVSLATQVRESFFGAEALRQQRGPDEVKVMVRLPRADRERLSSFEQLMLRTPTGGEIPLLEAAFVQEGRAETGINREDGRRIIRVTADVDEQITNPAQVNTTLQSGPLDALVADFPGLSYGFGGQQQDFSETFATLKVGFPIAMFVVFALLAIPLRSYSHGLVIMAAIPLGFIGAVVGHLMLGYDLSIISIMGLVALAGIAVNDSLVLVVSINELRAEGLTAQEAVVQATMRRFRPILLTSVTTFFGLAPMIFETSVQARFLIPMAISLGFGVMIATVFTLLVIPALYLLIEDIKAFYGVGQRTARGTPAGGSPEEMAEKTPA